MTARVVRAVPRHPSIRCRADRSCTAPPVAGLIAKGARPTVLVVWPLATAGRIAGTLLCAEHLAVAIDLRLMAAQPEASR